MHDDILLPLKKRKEEKIKGKKKRTDLIVSRFLGFCSWGGLSIV